MQEVRSAIKRRLGHRVDLFSRSRLLNGDARKEEGRFGEGTQRQRHDSSLRVRWSTAFTRSEDTAVKLTPKVRYSFQASRNTFLTLCSSSHLASSMKGARECIGRSSTCLQIASKHSLHLDVAYSCRLSFPTSPRSPESSDSGSDSEAKNGPSSSKKEK